jgi:hypothetical protein
MVYEVPGKVGTCSVILGDAFRKGGVSLHNISSEGEEEFRFPDDTRLSADIKIISMYDSMTNRNTYLGKMGILD